MGRLIKYYNMKKFLIFIFGIILFSSCNETKKHDAYNIKTDLNEFLNINGCNYYKIKIGNHTVYQYTFGTYTGTGSDIIHFEDMCDYCKNK